MKTRSKRVNADEIKAIETIHHIPPKLRKENNCQSVQHISDKNMKNITTSFFVKKTQAGTLVFPKFPDFRPNKTPKEVLQAGSFGGTYFRNIKSSVSNTSHKEAWKEFPSDWVEGLKISLQVASPTYDKNMNKYKVKCGASLTDWENSGWIKAQDPYGWFQWYCRFYLGRRSSDDQRQINRWKSFDSRFKTNLINRIKKADTLYDDYTVSPAIRQSLLHWGIEVTPEDLSKSYRTKSSLKQEQRLLDLVPLI